MSKIIMNAFMFSLTVCRNCGIIWGRGLSPPFSTCEAEYQINDCSDCVHDCGYQINNILCVRVVLLVAAFLFPAHVLSPFFGGVWWGVPDHGYIVTYRRVYVNTQ